VISEYFLIYDAKSLISSIGTEIKKFLNSE